MALIRIISRKFFKEIKHEKRRQRKRTKFIFVKQCNRALPEAHVICKSTADYNEINYKFELNKEKKLFPYLAAIINIKQAYVTSEIIALM